MKILRNLLTGLLVYLICISSGVSQITGTIETDASKIKFKANTIVYIEHTDAKFSLPEKNPVINQLGLKFTPRVLPVIIGTTVDFLNSDDVLHNVFSPDACANKFNLGTWPKNETKSFKYEKLGCESVLLCNVHPEMEAYVVVLQNPYFAVTDKNGNFIIENVPPGKYNLKVWNERLRAKDQEITVPASGKLEVSYTLTK